MEKNSLGESIVYFAAFRYDICYCCLLLHIVLLLLWWLFPLSNSFLCLLFASPNTRNNTCTTPNHETSNMSANLLQTVPALRTERARIAIPSLLLLRLLRIAVPLLLHPSHRQNDLQRTHCRSVCSVRSVCRVSVHLVVPFCVVVRFASPSETLTAVENACLFDAMLLLLLLPSVPTTEKEPKQTWQQKTTHTYQRQQQHRRSGRYGDEKRKQWNC